MHRPEGRLRLIAYELSDSFRALLPETYRILQVSNLTVCDSVNAVVLSGSRGPKGGYRSDSDVDLTLLIDTEYLREAANQDLLLRETLATTLNCWRATVELDTAAAFEKSDCALKCFYCRYDELDCRLEQPDCFAVYKTQKGFDGTVPEMGLQISKVHPLICIWHRHR